MLILASKSEARRRILETLGIKFKAVPSNISERPYMKMRISPKKLAELLAEKKAEKISKLYPCDIVLGVDTVVYSGAEIIGQAENKKEAYQTLKKLSGKKHKVISGICIKHKGRTLVSSETTIVYFDKIKDSDLKKIIKSGWFRGKSGCFSIEGKGSKYIKRITGDFYNVVGLPVHRFYKMLDQI